MTGSGLPGCGPSAPPWLAELQRHYPALANLSPEWAARLCARGRAVTAPTGALAFDENSACDGLTMLTGGAIRVVRTTPQGREILLYRVSPGESCILTVCCLLGRASYAARGVVETDLSGVTIPADLFDALVADAPEFRAFVFEMFGDRIASMMQLVEEIAFHRLESRIAAFLLRGFAGSGARDLSITHQQLADEVGSVREIVSRTLESLQRRGALSLARGRLTLADPAALAAAAGDLAAQGFAPDEPRA